jgi:hypothetical protein
VTFKSRKCVVVDGVFASHFKFPQLFSRVLNLFQVVDLSVLGGSQTPKISSM